MREHVNGTSFFIDDYPPLPNELTVNIIYSPVAVGTIIKLSFTKFLQQEGVVAAFTAKDFINNRWGPIKQDTPLLAEKNCHYVGEPIAVVAGISQEVLSKAKKLIELKIVAKGQPLTFTQAIKRKKFIGGKQTISSGKIKKLTGHQLSGQFSSGPQEHIYLESQAAIVYPQENGDLKIESSTQHPTEVQHVVAHGLGLQYNQVVCSVKRLGGAFGGKESQSSHFAALCALVSQKTNRPARLILNREDDMVMTGKRHPFKSFYKIYFDKKGKINGLKVDLYADGGAYMDLSWAIMQRALLHVDSAYYISNCQFNGYICRTNFAPNTAFRGFGVPQAAALIEHIIEEIAFFLKKDALEIRKLNCYKKRNLTPYGQKITDNNLINLINKLEKTANYQSRQKSIEKFNKKNSYLVRGLSLVPVKFGISFTSTMLNQGNALVNIHVDGSIQISTGAVEMGQGVNHKIQQLVSECLAISSKFIKIMPTSTEKNHNTSPTAASSGYDINAAATLMAVKKLKKRLTDFAEKQLKSKVIFKNNYVHSITNHKQKISFPQLVKSCYMARIGLGEYAFYATPKICFDPTTGQGRPFLYYTTGAAISEVEIDCLTGQIKVARSDILMDLGRPINKKIDMGQVAGAFCQGMGWVMLEQLRYSSKAELLTKSLATYKIPTIEDIPPVWNINFIENRIQREGICGGKAVGEPPFVLAISVWTAIKNALSSLDLGPTSDLSLPITAENVLQYSARKDFLSQI